MDWFSIEQDDADLKLAGVRSLIYYAANAEIMLIPTRELTIKAHKPYALPKYGERGWCRLEVFVFTLCQAMRGMASEHGDAHRGSNPVRLFASTVKGELTIFDTVNFAAQGHRNYVEFLHGGAHDMPSQGELSYESDRALISEVQEKIIRLYGYAVVKKACSSARETATLAL